MPEAKIRCGLIVAATIVVAGVATPPSLQAAPEPTTAARQQHVQAMLAHCPHPADGAAVVDVAPVAPDILAIELQSGTYHYGSMDPYTPQPGDQLTGGKTEWVGTGDTIAEQIVGQTIERQGADGNMHALGTISFDHQFVLKPDRVTGTRLDDQMVEVPEAYAISSSDDPAYATPQTPAAVYRKSKPDCPNGAAGGFAYLYDIYLKLPAPLKPGATYTVQFMGLNAQVAAVKYTHDPRSVRSEAVHASQIGYDPAAPFKRGYLSIWLGTGGGYQYASPPQFELLNAQTGQTVFTGTATLAKAKDAPEHLQTDKNYAMTAVYWLDFSRFNTPGTYKLYVAGIGTSYAFTIGRTVWNMAFETSMKGILAQRSGIALGPPFSAFKRPAAYAPGARTMFQLDITLAGGQEGGRGDDLVKLFKAHALKPVTGVWGGYQDAGDWDAYTTSLHTAYLLTEMFDIARPYTEKLQLSLPADEAQNQIPDLLDEAQWGLAEFRRLQLPSGAVRDGYGDGWGVRPGDVSWDDSNPVGVYAPSVATTYDYAAAAGQMARVLAPYDARTASGYGQSAALAWQWAEGQMKTQDAKMAARQAARRANAAAQLYWLTKEAAYHDAFRQVTELTKPVPATYNGGWIEPMGQDDADFTYARLPNALADATLQTHARERFALAAKVGRYFMQHNAFNIATAYPGVPCGDFLGYFTSPGIINTDLVRAACLSQSRDDLATVIASTNFTLGANPQNLVMTTGLGEHCVQFPLKLDSRWTGQPAPVGITVYGPADQTIANPSSNWVHIWMLGNGNAVPNSRAWPAQESYYDVFGWPGCNEFTVDHPPAMAAYTWCFLASGAQAGK